MKRIVGVLAVGVTVGVMAWASSSPMPQRLGHTSAAAPASAHVPLPKRGSAETTAVSTPWERTPSMEAAVQQEARVEELMMELEDRHALLLDSGALEAAAVVEARMDRLLRTR